MTKCGKGSLLVMRAKDYLHAWQWAQGGVIFPRWPTNQSSNVLSLLWEPPPLGYYKCNVDASFWENRGLTGYGMYFRDWDGRFVAAKTYWSSHMLTVCEGDAQGLFHALTWAIHSQLNRVIFELHCKVVVDNINGSRANFSYHF